MYIKVPLLGCRERPLLTSLCQLLFTSLHTEHSQSDIHFGHKVTPNWSVVLGRQEVLGKAQLDNLAWALPQAWGWILGWLEESDKRGRQGVSTLRYGDMVKWGNINELPIILRKEWPLVFGLDLK